MTNLAQEIKTGLPSELNHFLKLAGEVANTLGYKLYLVGGIVRDLLLGQANLDVDLAVEGDAVILAQKLIDIHPGKIITHPHFITATIQWGQLNTDLATTRSETYTEPGALPRVKSSSISNDLFRRDFTINAMAVNLNPEGYGELVDPHGGMADLNNRLLRVLHERSFIDDATRILRCLRYKERLDFQIEPFTLQMLRRDIPRLDTISGDRIRHELELILREKEPERVLCLAEELTVLQQLHLALKGDVWLADRFEQARQISSPRPPSTSLYLALLAYRLNHNEKERLITRLRLPKTLSQILRDTLSLKDSLKTVAVPKLAPSRVYHLLQKYSPTAIKATLLTSNTPEVREHLHFYLNKLRYVKPALTGDDLISMGVPPGPRIKEILENLHNARLDGKVKDKEGEVEMVRRLL